MTNSHVRIMNIAMLADWPTPLPSKAYNFFTKLITLMTRWVELSSLFS